MRIVQCHLPSLNLSMNSCGSQRKGRTPSPGLCFALQAQLHPLLSTLHSSCAKVPAVLHPSASRSDSIPSRTPFLIPCLVYPSNPFVVPCPNFYHTAFWSLMYCLSYKLRRAQTVSFHFSFQIPPPCLTRGRHLIYICWMSEWVNEYCFLTFFISWHTLISSLEYFLLSYMANDFPTSLGFSPS